MFLATAVLTGIAVEKYAYGIWQIPKGKYLTPVIRHQSFLGLVSYSFYLIHQPLLLLIRRLPVVFHGLLLNISPHERFLLSVAMYPFLLILAYLMHRFVEMPSAKLSRINRSSRVTV